MKTKKQKALVLFGAIILIILGSSALVFQSAKSRVVEEWETKVNHPRSPEDIRGLVDSLMQYRHDPVPSAVPQSGWDNQLCAANAINMINFLLGEERLDMSSAWEFARVNEENLELVWDRVAMDDFEEEGGQIIETFDRGFWLSRILETTGRKKELSSDRLYVLGYHYVHTNSDGPILAAGESWNSHLMLILGRADNTWWGYHMFHDPQEPDASPFRIEDIGERMPKEFDVMYIWEVTDTQMPKTGSDVRIVYNAPEPSVVMSIVGHESDGGSIILLILSCSAYLVKVTHSLS